jgi:hypothetical protein
MAARTLPTLPAFVFQQELTSSEMNQVVAYQAFWANAPMFSMHQATTNSITSGTPTQVIYDVSDYDTDSGRSGTTPFSYIVPFAGRWTFSGVINLPGNATGYRYVALYQNGTAVTAGKANSAVNTASNSTVVEVTKTIPCNVGDVIGIYCVQNSGSALSTVVSDMTQTSFFEGRLVSLASP